MSGDIYPVLTGIGASFLFQLFKGHGWSPWLLKVLALGTGFGAGFGVDSVVDGGALSATAGGVHASTAALATYAVAFQSTKLGDGIAQGWGPKVLQSVSDLLQGIAKATANGNGKPPPPTTDKLDLPPKG